MNKAEIVFDKIIKEEDGIMLLNIDDGETQDNAIVILGAEDNDDGVNYEYRVLKAMFKDYEVISQSLIFDDNKVYDLIKISSKEKIHTIWFEITDFYGRDK
jgi:hypothetical protein